MKCRICSMLLFSVSILAQPSHTSISSLRKILAQQGFTGALDGKITIERLGVIHCGSRQFETFYHTWEDSHPPGRAIHAAYRVVLLEGGTKYVGQYKVPDRPVKITRTAIVFNFRKEDGNIIECEGDDLPGSVVLDGQGADRFK